MENEDVAAATDEEARNNNGDHDGDGDGGDLSSVIERFYAEMESVNEETFVEKHQLDDANERAQLVVRRRHDVLASGGNVNNKDDYGTAGIAVFEAPFSAPLAPFRDNNMQRIESDYKNANIQQQRDTSARQNQQNRQSLRPSDDQLNGHLLTNQNNNHGNNNNNRRRVVHRSATYSQTIGCGSSGCSSGGCGISGTTGRMASSTLSIPLAPMIDGEDDCRCPKAFIERENINKSLFFEDGERCIDYVLAYKCNTQPLVEEENANKRRVFEDNLITQGLETEHVFKEVEQIHFVKLHAPLEVLRRYAEILKLRMPMKEFEVKLSARKNRLQRAVRTLQKIPGMAMVDRPSRTVFSSLRRIFRFFIRYIYIDESNFPRLTHRFTAVFSRDKEYLFDIREDCFFTTAVRSRIVQFILDRQRFPGKDKNDISFGIERLIAQSVYIAAYPLHDGEISEEGTMRENLYSHWASVRKWYRYQPLDYIKEYFGVKIGLYFAWLGYYTYMLLLASIMGIICFTYSWISLKDYVPVRELCEKSGKNVTMCPLCDWCDFWDLRETCFYAKISYLIDNPSTVFFAVFMSFWATLFLEMWKRYSAEITHRWDLTGFDVHEEHPRPQYLARLEHLPATRVDYVTNIREPQVPFWRMKLPATVFSFSVVLLLMVLPLAAVVALVVYRVTMVAILRVTYTALNTSTTIMLTTASAAFVNLCFLYILNYVYNYLAEYLTEMEMWRTQTQFDDSLTLKIYLLQFVNYYASIFYIAFFKGKFVGHPGLYNTFFDHRQEECSAGGCLTELCIQLAIIMIGKQAFNTLLEVVFPMFWRKVLSVQIGLSRLFSHKRRDKKPESERWLRDLKLLDWGPRSLFPEYLEMVLQYGFVTIFVAAFPLAPFFALLNNIFEMRLDAKKLLSHHKRPVSQRVRDIGVWYRILDCIGKLSVITNGFIIAFTSDFIPRMVYRTKHKSLEGYMYFPLSRFNVQDSKSLRSLVGDHGNVTTCLYTDFREPPESPDHYELSTMFYVVLACRLGFVVLFENFVALVMILVRWCIPDMSVELRDQIRREAYVTNEIIIQEEAKRAREERAKRASSMGLTDNHSTTTSIADNTEKFIKLEQLLMENLTQSQMDAIMHCDDVNTGITGTTC